ncbi:hypothetical protein S40285_04894 [Stachybotrys chlorohalonatus IBT 40285]|uniref:Uncharacterized protein n=1 Tax=Stachybotrys chlorohalonatus (strain IBT 40285) TaxID=1283841 RepID=A0A084QP61_STAC4|nr:hypothetical protein S40285_04894 [Stachybotrys chlorohalonata IBT 40285]
MAMKPPAKRRRVEDLQAHDSDDSDELNFKPHEVLARRDPGYDLSLKRAHADHRFQATMAHIFDKYGRDFEGIGDEIDMFTGEIVVNNGHLHRMRNEGDVGDGTHLDEDEDEDEDDEGGMLLGDLLDDEDFDDVVHEQAVANTQHVPRPRASSARRKDDGTADEDEENRVPHGREATSLVPAAQNGHQAFPARPGQLFPGPHNWPHPFGPTTAPFGFEPVYGLGGSPFDLGPWELPYGSPTSSMDHLGLPGPLSHVSTLERTRDRYDFPAQSGDSSIWAPRSGYKDDEAPSDLPGSRTRRSRVKTMSKIRRKILPPHIHQTLNDDDEDAILNGKSPEPNQMQGLTRIHMDQEDEPRQPSPCNSSKSGLTQTKQNSGKPATASAQTGQALENVPDENMDFQFERPGAEGTLVAEHEAAPPPPSLPANEQTQPQADRDDPSPAKNLRPARNRKPIDHPGKGFPRTRTDANVKAQLSVVDKKLLPLISEDATTVTQPDALVETPIIRKITVEIPSMDPRCLEEYMEVDLAAEETTISDPTEAEMEDRLSIIQDSQETPNSSIRPMATVNPSSSDGLLVADSPKPDNNALFELSDDEMPTLFTVPIPRVTQPSLRDSNEQSLQDNTANKQQEATPGVEAIREKPVTSSTDSPDLVVPDACDPSPPEHTGAVASDTIVESLEEIRHIADHAQVDRDTHEPKSARLVPESSPNTDAYLSQKSDDEACQRADEFRSSPTPSPINEVPDSASTTSSLPEEVESSSSEDSGDEASAAGLRYVMVDSGQGFGVSVFKPGKSPGGPVQATSPLPETGVDNSHRSPTPSEPIIPSPPQARGPSPAQAATATAAPPKPRTPRTPRRSILHATKVPRSRRSVLSLLSDDDEDSQEDVDELSRSSRTLLKSGSASAVVRRIWKSSARTTEVCRTPVKRHRAGPASPGSVVKTPGGTTRTCGVDGYRCGRDFCFTCL